jgi:O-antigen/teichoic acid export membrane protein
MQLARANARDSRTHVPSALGRIEDLVPAMLRRDGGRPYLDAATTFLVRVASAAILYLSQVALARVMGDTEYGIYVVVWTWILLLGGLSTLGMSTAVMRLLPEYRETGAIGLLRGLLFGSRMIVVAVSTGVALVGLVGLQLLGDRLDSPYVLPAYLALICLPLVTLTDVQDGIGRANGWVGIALLPPYVLRPLLVLALMLAAHRAGFEMSAVTAVGAAIAATWASAVLQTCFMEKRLLATVEPGPRRVTVGPWLRMSMPLFAIAGCEVAIQNADVLVMSHYLAPADVAVYFAAAKTIGIMLFVPYAVGSAFAHRFATLQARGDREGLEAAVASAVRWTFWPSLAIAAGLLALGHPLLSLFGPRFTQGYGLMAILAVGFLAKAATGPCEYILNMLGQQASCAAMLAVTTLLAIGANLALVPHWGLQGVAMAMALAWTSSAILGAWIMRRRLQLDAGLWGTFVKTG